MNKRVWFAILQTKSRAIQDAAHAIGLNCHAPYNRHGREFYKPFRNFFGTDTAWVYFSIWAELEKLGYAESYKPSHFGAYESIFRLTRSGLDWLGVELGIIIHDYK